MIGTQSQNQNETPTLSETILTAVRAAMLEMFVCMPGIVQSYDNVKNTASVQPAFKRKYKNGKIVNLPIINNVPVAFPRANNAALTFPLKKDDSVLLLFSQRSMDSWKSEGGVISVNDPRTFNISDAIAIPGVYPMNKKVTVDPNKFVMRYGSAKVSITEDKTVEIEAKIGKIKVTDQGKVTIGNGTIDLVALVDEILTGIQALTVGTALGPSSPPINLATFVQIQTKLAMIKE